MKFDSQLIVHFSFDAVSLHCCIATSLRHCRVVHTFIPKLQRASRKTAISAGTRHQGTHWTPPECVLYSADWFRGSLGCYRLRIIGHGFLFIIIFFTPHGLPKEGGTWLSILLPLYSVPSPRRMPRAVHSDSLISNLALGWP